MSYYTDFKDAPSRGIDHYLESLGLDIREFNYQWKRTNHPYLDMKFNSVINLMLEEKARRDKFSNDFQELIK